MTYRADLSRRTFIKTAACLPVRQHWAPGCPATVGAQQKRTGDIGLGRACRPDIVADFERQHGIKVRAKYYTGGDNMLGLIAQSPPGTFDLILSDAEYVQQLNAADYIERLDPADYPFDDFFPEFQHFPGHWKGMSCIR